MCSLMFCGIFCQCLLGPFKVRCHLILRFLCFYFCPDDLVIGESRVLKSSTIIGFVFICAFICNSRFFVELGAPEFGTYV